MSTHNLFSYAQKELVIDAFFCWLINESNINEELAGFQDDLFNWLSLDKPDGFVKLSAATQVDNIDLLITAEASSGNQQIVFENKMYSSEHSNQLERYKEKIPDAVGHYYLKLGYIHKNDRKAADQAEYIIKKAEDLLFLLDPYMDKHPIINEFHSFLEINFVQPQRDFSRYVEENAYEKLENASFQHYVIDEIMERMEGTDYNVSHDIFKTGNNPDGSCYTQLKFNRKQEVYKNQHETLFFRIDKRDNKFYLRINQYASGASKFWSDKKKRLNAFRDVAGETAVSLGLTSSTPSNRGKNESEIIIFFFKEDNSIKDLIEKAPALAKKLSQTQQ